MTGDIFNIICNSLTEYVVWSRLNYPVLIFVLVQDTCSRTRKTKKANKHCALDEHYRSFLILWKVVNMLAMDYPDIHRINVFTLQSTDSIISHLGTIAAFDNQCWQIIIFLNIIKSSWKLSLMLQPKIRQLGFALETILYLITDKFCYGIY